MVEKRAQASDTTMFKQSELALLSTYLWIFIGNITYSGLEVYKISRRAWKVVSIEPTSKEKLIKIVSISSDNCETCIKFR